MTEHVADGVVLLQNSSLGELISKLKHDIPKSLSVIGTVQSIICSKLEGKVYANGWPEFSAVICQYDGILIQWLLGCYATKAEDILCLLEGAKLTVPGQKWAAFGVDEAIADLLLKSSSLSGSCSGSEKIVPGSSSLAVYYLPQSSVIEYRTCPEGFTLKSLSEKHAKVVAPYWPIVDDVQAKQSLFEMLIKHYHSVGVFMQDSPEAPIAWCMQYPSGRPAHLHVTEPYRRRGFAMLLITNLCKYIREDGLLPEVAVEDPAMEDLLKKLGFVKHGQAMTVFKR